MTALSQNASTTIILAPTTTGVVLESFEISLDTTIVVNKIATVTDGQDSIILRAVIWDAACAASAPCTVHSPVLYSNRFP
ncbi:hypothetical protein [Escherichia coli]|uniref:hypothetical protein n=1 Tax=Escherichia coli TaxID=562 RepID=UPI0003EF108B|nr:hypothetical protein [Escherichia coli]